MKNKLTQSLVDKAPYEGKAYWIDDTELRGFRLHVGSHSKVYFVRYRINGKENLLKIGDSRLFSTMQAREVARKKLADIVSTGIDPREATRKQNVLTLGDIITQYETIGNSYMSRITKIAFADWLDTPVKKITLLAVEQWRATQRTKNTTINKKTSSLSGLFNWAVKRDILEHNPLAKLQKLNEYDSVKKIRYLTPDERQRLMTALDEREQELRAQRQRSRQHTNRLYLEDLSDKPFADYLKPAVIVSLNTGIRRNALLNLLWSDIDFDNNTILLRAQTAKSRKQNIIPMNKTTRDTLLAWRECVSYNQKLVFGGEIQDPKKSWHNVLKRANITNFRWHDMRHDFASQLVMKGVDLNTVRELMTHATLDMTLRYAHLAPNKKQAAVDLLD